MLFLPPTHTSKMNTLSNSIHLWRWRRKSTEQSKVHLELHIIVDHEGAKLLNPKKKIEKVVLQLHDNYVVHTWDFHLQDAHRKHHSGHGPLVAASYFAFTCACHGILSPSLPKHCILLLPPFHSLFHTPNKGQAISLHIHIPNENPQILCSFMWFSSCTTTFATIMAELDAKLHNCVSVNASQGTQAKSSVHSRQYPAIVWPLRICLIRGCLGYLLLPIIES